MYSVPNPTGRIPFAPSGLFTAIRGNSDSVITHPSGISASMRHSGSSASLPNVTNMRTGHVGPASITICQVNINVEAS